MGALKDSLIGRRGHVGGSARGRWRDVRTCPVCGRSRWCQISDDGATVLCHTGGDGEPRESRHGSYFWVHHLEELAHIERWQPSLRESTVRADPDTRDRAYGTLLRKLGLSQTHRAALHKRGLSDEHIARAGYATLPLRGRAAAARAVEDLCPVSGVPGFIVATGDNDREYRTLAGSPGLLVPVSGLEGRIVALKIRRDEAREGEPKYVSLSSSHKGGPRAESALHVPVFASRERGRELVITEGELKADAASVLSGLDVISVPGVASWKLALPAVKALAPERVIVAFDSDADVNPSVAHAAHCLLRALRAEGVSASLLRWDAAEAKGIDDLFLARARGSQVNP